MFQIRIKPDGTIEKRVPDNDLFYWDEIESSSVLGYSTFSVTLMNGFTVKSYFKMLVKYPQLQLLDMWFIEYMKKYREVKDTNKPPVVDKLSLQRFFEYDQSSIDPSSPDILESTTEEANGLFSIDTSNFVYNDNKSINTYIHVFGESKDDDDTYSVSMEPLENILGCILEIKEKVMIQTHDPKRSSYKSDEIETHGDVNLFEFVTSVISEISFFGNDDDKKKELDILKDTFDDIEKRLGDDTDDE